MTHCSGCGVTLGWKKYRFQRMWRIQGYFCKNCMLDLGRDFDKHGKITLPTRKCDLCSTEYYFLKPYHKGTGHRNYCHVCHEAATNGVIPTTTKNAPPPQPKKLPLVMMIFAGLGGFMMLAGLLFTMMSTGDDANVANILFGAVTTALGFVLVRKTLKSRSLLLGKPQHPNAAK